MFLDEARLASSIHHPNVVASLDVVAEQGELLVVMEYVHGETLAGLLRLSRSSSDDPPVSVVARILCDALEGLHAAHTASMAGRCLDIVHRDVSPQNIMVGADGNTRMLDFGIAQAALRSQVTAAGTVKGKLAYMSPEQVQGLTIDARTDVFAAGIVLWEALTGRRLFFAPDSRDAVSLLLSAPIPAPSTIVPTVPAALDEVVLKALEREPNARFETAHQMAEALRLAVGEGSRREVAAWVGRVAREGLARRAEQLEALEASAFHTQAALALPVVTASSPRAAPAPLADGTPTRATSATSILPSPTRPSWRQRLPWIFAAAGLLVAGLSWRANVDGSEPSTSAPAGAASAPAVAAVSPPASSELPETDDSTPTIASEALPLAPASVESPPPKRPPAAPLAAPARAKSCSPPYRIDASGVRRIKPECL
jgi:eukaryotic-like serine/threonine-protein kinase